MKAIKIVLLLILFVIALALGAQNQVSVEFNYLIAKGEFHLAWLLGSVFVLGFVISWFIFGSLHIKANLKVRKLTKKLKQYEGTSVAKAELN